MAVRLSVVMIQSPPRTPNAERVAESVVGELIGLSGIDLTLVEPLERLETSSTDHLTLTSLSGDIAVLDWRTPQETMAALTRLGIDGVRAPHPHDDQATASAPAQRKFYLFDLQAVEDAQVILAALQQLNATRSVRTFALGLAPKPNSATLPVTGRPSDANASPDAAPSQLSPSKATPTALGSLPGGPGRAESDLLGASDSRTNSDPEEERLSEDGTGRGSDGHPVRGFGDPVRGSGHPAQATGKRAESKDPPAGDPARSTSHEPSSRRDDGLDLDQLIDQLDELDP